MPLENADIQALATALKGLQPEAATVNAAAVKLPTFWSGNVRYGLNKQSLFSRKGFQQDTTRKGSRTAEP